MLRPAQLYADEIKRKMWEIAYDDKYKYFNDGYVYDYVVNTSTWSIHEFASVNSDNEVIGLIKYSVDRWTNNACGLCVVNFTDNKMVFGMDLARALDNIFVKFGLRKLNFVMICGNPIEESYDNVINKYGGRVVGFRRDDTRLMNGEYRDVKLYEITRKDYLKHRR